MGTKTKKKSTLINARDVVKHIGPITNGAALAALIVYLCGYLIDSTLLGSLGIGNIALFKGQYIETGFQFLLLSVILTVLPIEVIRFIKKHQIRFNTPTFYVYGRFLGTLNFFFIMAFFSLFINTHDWTHRNTLINLCFGTTRETGTLFLFYISFIVLLWFVSGIRNARIKKKGGTKDFATIPQSILLITFLLASLAFDFVIFFDVPWMLHVIQQMLNYVILLAAFTFFTYKSWKDYRKSDYSNEYAYFYLTRGTAIIILFYLVVTAYSFSVYKYLPMDRGGKLPSTKISLQLTQDFFVHHPELQFSQGSNNDRSIGMYLIAEDDNRIFVSTKYALIDDDYGQIYAFNNDDVFSRHYMPEDTRRCLTYGESCVPVKKTITN